MKRVILVMILVLWGHSICWGVETAPRITDREILERLTRIEEGQKAILREMDKRFASIDKRFEQVDKRFESMDKRFGSMDKRFEEIRQDMNARFDQLINIMIGIISAFAGIVVVTIGFAIWDRRTMIRPFETKVRAMERQLEEMASRAKGFDEDKLSRLIDAMKKMAAGNKEIAEALRSFNLL